MRRAARPAIVLAGALLAGLGLAGAGANAETVFEEVTGRLAVQGRYFPQSSLHDGQREQAISFSAEPELYLEGERGDSLTLTPFFRYDSADSRRSHVDLREAYALVLGELADTEWELRVGIDKVFWGVVESRHLVDIINQTDAVEHPDLEEKLGQPMAHLTWLPDWGTLELFALPYFRKRTFPGRGGRLRQALVVDGEATRYESAARQHHLDVAARYSHSVDIFDFGIALFDGTNRAPTLSLGLDTGGAAVFVPEYEQIRQLSLDAQITTGPWLVKLESYWRDGEKDAAGLEDDFAALVGGFEYTLYGVLDSNADFGVLAEWLYDERGSRAPHAYENDLFAAVRLTLNDEASSTILAGVSQDLDTPTRALFIETSRRLSDNLSLGLDGTVFLDVVSDDVQYGIRKDSFLQLELSYSF